MRAASSAKLPPMTFPDRPFPDAGSYADAYFDRLAAASASVDRAALARAAAILETAYKKGATVYVCGNGGSAAIANTFVCDHGKLVQTDTALTARVISLSTNVPMMTAISNDAAYEDVFVYQLRTLGRPGDVLVTVSASGDSENVVRAAAWARENGLHVIALTGFAGGRTGGLADVHLHVEGDNYGVIEDTHQSLMHILAQFIRQAHMPEELVATRKF